MSARAHKPSLAFLVIGAVVCTAAPAWSQPALDVKLSLVEVSIGLTINGRLQDVNTAPDCVELSLPCTHERPSKFGGLGLSMSIARNLSDRLAITSDVSTFASQWDSPASLRRKRPAVAHATSVFVGPRISSGFFYPGNADREPGRLFGQVLVGAEASDVVPLRPALLAGAGADVIIPRGGSRGIARGPAHDLTFRMALDYRLTPGAGRNLSGWRFVFGVVFGPRLSRS